MDDMKKCTQCGADLPAEAMFCSECGARQGVLAAAAPAAESAGMSEPASTNAPSQAPAAPPAPEQGTPVQPVPVQATPIQPAPVQPALAAPSAIGLQYGTPAQTSMDPFANAPQPMQPGAYATQQPPFPAQPPYPAQGMGTAPQQAWQTQAPYPGQTPPPVPPPPAGKQAKAPKAPNQPQASVEGGAASKKVPIPTVVMLGLSLVILVVWFLLYNSPNLPEFDFSAATANAAVFSFLLMSILSVVGAVLFRFQLRGKKLAVLGDVFIGIVMLVMLYGMSVTVLSEDNLFYKLFIGITGG